MMYRAVGQPARKVLTVMTAAAACVSLAAAPAATASTTPVACEPWQTLRPAGAAGQEYVIRNKPSINHNEQGMCVSDPGEGAGFTVTRSPGQAPSPKVRAYPYIGTGCFERACAAGGEGATPRAGALGNYSVHWATVTPQNSGVWNASLDLWLGPHVGAGTSEVMIWLRYSKPSWWKGLYPTATIDGAKWYLVPHTTPDGRYYISFRRATPVAAATLRLAPFMAEAERLGAVSASSLLWSVQAGFEIWSGGAGLAVTKFSLTQ
jgi:Glycosyl hydrolase family 12